eukprot:NODE_1011_length_1762_cov_46.442499_g893_i0.p1 GENE.NODE_1011_length_1762_cov_46.442499_g893_i0~~NODE_1011_length_1762_cov_46.442499_g893_i0.p1  ORF type:complete len:504 (+),score=86.60 NODE_1011_length_1762_cov_46.442499_g893_i0:116-1627(+)
MQLARRPLCHAAKQQKLIRRQLSNAASLDPSLQRLCAIAGYTASGNLSKLSKLWAQLPQEEHAAGTEVILQNIVINGVPRTLMALTTCTEIGIKDRIVIDEHPSSHEKMKKHAEQGTGVIREIYGYKYKRFLNQVHLLHPAFGRWVRDFHYGRVRSRPGLSQATRSLCELAAVGGQFVFPQFRGGILNALTCGASLEQVRGVLDMTAEVWGMERQAMVDSLWHDLSQRQLSAGWKAPSQFEERAESQIVRSGDGLHNDLKHLVPESEISTPNWRHPFVTSLRNVVDLSDLTRVLAFAAAHSASGNLSELRRDWTYLEPQHHRMGLEIVLETVAFTGFHRVYNSLRALHEQGVCDKAISPSREKALDSRLFTPSGEALLQQIYTSAYPLLGKSISKMHPDIWSWIVEFIYGQVLSRDCPGLSVAQRELAALSCMVGGATFPQLRSHMRGAMNCGASADQVRGILDQTATVWGRPNQSYIDGYWLDFNHGPPAKKRFMAPLAGGQ